MEVIQDDSLKEICSLGSYGLNPGKMQLDRPIHCWSFFWVPCQRGNGLQMIFILIGRLTFPWTWGRAGGAGGSGRQPPPSSQLHILWSCIPSPQHIEIGNWSQTFCLVNKASQFFFCEISFKIQIPLQYGVWLHGVLHWSGGCRRSPGWALAPSPAA